MSVSSFSGEPQRAPGPEMEQRIQAVRDLKPGARIHISGVCGTGTSAVLSLLKQLGYTVTGSDKAFYPPMGELVKKLADVVYTSFDAKNLNPKPDLVVIGNALSRGNPEVEFVLEQQIPFASMPEVFSALLIGKREDCRTSIVVTGTHGKTTTSALIASILEKTGRKPGYFIGGMPTTLASTIRPWSREMPAEQRVVVLEGDEYDSAFFAKFSKFHCYRPDVGIITNIEFDHGDIFASIADIEREFKGFALSIPSDGLLFVCDQSERALELVNANKSELKAKVLRYGLSNSSHAYIKTRTPWKYQDIPERRYGQEIIVVIDGRELVLKTKLSGEHNALNILVAAATARRLGVGAEELQDALKEFTQVLRRQQVIAEHNGVVAIEDFAHHPTEVKATLAGIRETYTKARIIAVFEPRSNTSRRAFFEEEYKQAFASADIAVIKRSGDAPIYSGVATETATLNVDALIDSLKQNLSDAIAFSSAEEINSHLQSLIKQGDVVVLMSNGDFGGLPAMVSNFVAEQK